MEDNYINALEAAKEYGLYLKVVTSIKSFESYNSFFNIFDEQDEACRRIVVLTKDKNLEEVYDQETTKEVESNIIVDGVIWLKSVSLLTNPNKIDLNNIMVSRSLVEKII
ncbi:hypothetical protein [Clostridium weizhouense]|uniref:PIN domain-containing protein n=1 Tax=Clostridium weizhouense TaxID=2859781 RepID=A0ABS7AJ27_9CLOT|nr:hypothetical protein [Clostridium weizhouense]MBW6408662.1 hypothetical protein [Clostridium weizhouense]